MEHLEEEEGIDLLEYWRIIVKRKWAIFCFVSAFILLCGIYTFTAVPKYKAVTTLLVEEKTSKILSIEDEFGYRRDITDLRFFKTQLKLLKSKSLAERVARRLNLLARPEFSSHTSSKKRIISAVKNVLSFKWLFPKSESMSSKPGINYSNPYFEVTETLRNDLKVFPVRETKLVEVSYISPSPVLAAEIINTLAEEFINFSIEKRYDATQQASDFLSEQIANLREDLAAKEKELQRYGKEKELFFLTDTENTAINKFADLIDAFTKAQIDRINAEAAYRELKELNVNALPHFVNNAMIQNLKTEYTRMKNEYEEKSKTFKSNYPGMIELKAKLDSMREELKTEIKKAVDAAESEYRSARKKELSLNRLLEEEKTNVALMNSNAILYNSLKIEVENKRKQFNSLVERLNETEVSARLGGLKTSNISIIDKAEPPKYPISPNKSRNFILAFLIGIFGGVGLCFLLEYLDKTVKGPEDVEKLVGLPSLGVIPYFHPEGKKRKRSSYYYKYKYSRGEENPESEDSLSEKQNVELVNYIHPKFLISENYRTVRTSILLSRSEGPPKSIVFTSALPQEGKSATVVNMAVAFSQLKKNILVVDADLRKPRLHHIFKIKNIGGLSGYLTGKVSIMEAIQKTSVENIWLLPSGPIPPNPVELIDSEKMKELMKEVDKIFDVVLIDSPPVLAVVDPIIICSFADSVVFIIQAGKTTYKPFFRAIKELQRTKIKIVGVIFNEVKAKDDRYYSEYYPYYRHQYYSQEESQQ